MITRLDLPHDFNVNVTPNDPSKEYSMDHTKFNYAENLFPTGDHEPITLEGVVTSNIEEMLIESDDALIPNNQTFLMKEDDMLSSPMSSDRMSNSLQDELDSLTYSSQPETPCESFVSSNDYTNPLSQIAYSSSFSDDMVEESEEPACFKRSNYDTSALMYGNDDMTTFSDIVNCNDVLRTDKVKETSVNNTIVCCYRNVSASEPPSIPSPSPPQADENFFSVQEQSPEDNRKGKISGLQRHALDLIFAVTDRPSRGLVLHMAAELGLHHITVKNFFSNGRRRLRRAAARLNDPERTRRENQRRKEKRRLAAIAATLPNGDKMVPSKVIDGAEIPREPMNTLSPERRALMEKLAVKVQRSVAQKAAQPTSKPTSAVPTEALSPQTHSNSASLAKNFCSNTSPMLSENSSGMTINFLSSNEDDLVNLLTYTAEPNLQHSHQGTNVNVAPVNAAFLGDSNNLITVNQEEGPYSPTSWQTLLNA